MEDVHAAMSAAGLARQKWPEEIREIADFPRTAILRRAAAAVAPGGTLLVVGHGRLAPWSWDPTLRMATAPEVLAALDLDDAAWEVVRCESAERTATGPDGQEAMITDEIVQVRARS